MTCWKPVDHRYDGSCDGQLVAPHYVTMPDFIRVYDTAVKTQGWTRKQKRLWREAVKLGVSRWQYPFVIVELKNPAAYRPEGITVRPFMPDPQYGAHSYGGFGLAPIEEPETSDYDEYAWNTGKGFALIHPKVVLDAWAGNVIGKLAGTICHEVGHALGFGHGGTGVMRDVMWPPYYPDAEELLALKAYWGSP